MNLSVPLPSSSTIPMVVGAAPALPLPAGSGAYRPTFADCLSGLCADVDALAVEPTDAGEPAAVRVNSSVQPTLPLASAVDDAPVLVSEPAADVLATASPQRPRRQQIDRADAPWPPDGLSSLPLVVATPAAVPVAVQDASALAGGAGSDGHRLGTDTPPLPVAEPAQTQASAAQRAPWFAGMHAQGSHLSVHAADTTQPTIPADAQQPESAAFTLPTAAAVTENPAPVTAVPFADTAGVTLPAPPHTAPVQTAAAPSAAPASAPLPVPSVHADTFPDRIAAHVHWLAEQGIGQARIHIHPRELGPVDVYLTLNGDQLRTDFSSAQPEVRQALEYSLPQLRQLLDQHGLQLAHADVSQRQHEQPTADADTGSAAGIETELPPAPGGSMPARVLSTRHLLDAYA